MIPHYISELVKFQFLILKVEFGSFQLFKFLKDQPVLHGDSEPLAKNAVVAYAVDALKVKDGAEVLLTSEGAPVLVSWKVGQGRGIAITRTTLGEAPTGKV